MASFFRRAGAQILRVLKIAADPAQDANGVQVYSKDVAGIVQLFARASDGTITQLTPTFTPTTQVFRYTVTGAEANPIPIALPAARASANYNVTVQIAGPAVNAFAGYRPLEATYTINGFDVECSSAPALQAGDLLEFVVDDLT